MAGSPGTGVDDEDVAATTDMMDDLLSLRLRRSAIQDRTVRLLGERGLQERKCVTSVQECQGERCSQ